MTAVGFVATTLEEFLDRTGPSEAALRLQRIGIASASFGILLATGIVALLLASTVRRADRDALVRVALLGGLVAAFGGVIEILGVSQIHGVGWWEALRGDNGTAAMMRLLGALLIVVGLVDHLGRPDAESATDAVDDLASRMSPPVFALGGIVVGLLSFAFDGHTNTAGPRVVHALVDVVHVTAGGLWFGGVVALAVLAVRTSLVDDGATIVHRFAAIATGALVAVSAAGVAMAAFILDDVGQLTSTDWGRLLIVRTALVVAAAVLGAYHHFVVVPRVAAPGGSGGRGTATLIAEAVLFTAVTVVTAFLVTTSPA